MTALLLVLLAVTPQTLATISTEYDSGDEGRAWNIALAARRIDGTVLGPGETFSFNHTVGPRGLEDGFRPAPELVDGDRVEGIGGGVCQVASTLYAAALEAGLTVEARKAHSRPVSYIRPGLDATVSYTRRVDLALRNDSTSRVTVHAIARAGRVSVEIRQAAPSPPPELALEVESEPAADGMVVTVVRLTRRDGGGEQRELVSQDLYRRPTG